MWLTFARTEFLVAPSKFRSRSVVAPRLSETGFNIRGSASELCFSLRNIAVISGGPDKNIISKEQASRQAVLL
jgi:hypothetical protein